MPCRHFREPSSNGIRERQAIFDWANIEFLAGDIIAAPKAAATPLEHQANDVFGSHWRIKKPSRRTLRISCRASWLDIVSWNARMPARSTGFACSAKTIYDVPRC